MRDRVARAARTFSDLDQVTVEFNRLERRGARVVGRTGRRLTRRRRALERDVQQAGRRLGRSTGGLRTDAGRLVERVKQIVR
jgi:type II secretory pathway component PulJ